MHNKEKNIYKKLKEIERNNKKCSFNNCPKKAINSHLISEWMLKYISFDNHIITDKAIINGKEPKSEPCVMGKEGIQFGYPLFCQEHDNELFSKIENKNTFIENWKREEINLLNLKASALAIYQVLMRGNVNRIKTELNMFTREELRQKENLRKEINNSYSNKPKLFYRKYELPYQTNSVASSIILENKTSDKSVNLPNGSIFVMPNITDYNSNVYYHLIVNDNKCYFIISSSDKNSTLFKHITKKLNSSNLKEKQIYITNLIITGNAFGTFINPKWWEKNLPNIENVFNGYGSELRKKVVNDRKKYHGFNLWNN